MRETLIPDRVRIHWSRYSLLSWQPVNSGLINKTFSVVDSNGIPQAIVQRLHPVFEAQVNLEIEAVTAYLDNKGVTTTRLIPTDRGALWAEVEGRIWRAMEYIPGRSYEKVVSAKMAFEAGKLVATFHHALNDFEHLYSPTSRNIHDTAAHIDSLRHAVQNHGNHRLFADISAFAEQILLAAQSLPKLDYIRPRHAHGDLKISNLLFDDQGRGHTLIDLDTVCQMIWPFEMGDALRSWCNPCAEDESQARLDLELFESALDGYFSTNTSITIQEREALVSGLIQISLELSARFITDSLNESYFGWDQARYRTRGEHNLARAKSMWNLYRDIRKKQSNAERIVKSHRR